MPNLGADSALVPVIDAIRILMSWRTIGDFRARVHHRLLDSPAREYDLEARPRTLSYRLVDTETGVIDSFDGESRNLVAAGERTDYAPHMLTFEPPPARLAFPMSLGIWGRATDNYRIVGGEYDADEIVLRLTSVRAPEVHGTLTVNRTQRKAIRLDTPTEGIHYKDAAPL